MNVGLITVIIVISNQQNAKVFSREIVKVFFIIKKKKKIRAI